MGVSDRMITCHLLIYLSKSWWWFQIILMFTPIWEKWTHFDEYCSKGSKPPTRKYFKSSSCLILRLWINEVSPCFLLGLRCLTVIIFMLCHMATSKNGNIQQCDSVVRNPPKQIYIVTFQMEPAAGGQFRWSASWSVKKFIQIDQMVHVTLCLLIFDPSFSDFQFNSYFGSWNQHGATNGRQAVPCFAYWIKEMVQWHWMSFWGEFFGWQDMRAHMILGNCDGQECRICDFHQPGRNKQEAYHGLIASILFYSNFIVFYIMLHSIFYCILFYSILVYSCIISISPFHYLYLSIYV